MEIVDQYSTKYYDEIETKLPELDLELIIWQYFIELLKCIKLIIEIQDPKKPRLDFKHPWKKVDELLQFQESPPWISRYYKLSKADFDEILNKMTDPRYHPPTDIDKFCDHLVVAGEFFSQYGTRHQTAKFTELMKLSTAKIIAAAHSLYAIAKMKVEEITADQFISEERTNKSTKAKKRYAAERKKIVLELDKQVSPKLTRNNAAQRILRKWDEDKYGQISIRTIQNYLKEAGRRDPKK